MSPVSWGYANSFSFVIIHRIDQRSRSLRDILFALTAHHQIGGSGFCHRRASTRGCVLSSFRHGTNHNALSSLRENTFKKKNGCQNMSESSWYWTNTEGDSTHLSRNFLWSECLQVGFWCQHIWFGSLVPSWFCQTTNQERLCEFSAHVSSWDFVLWLSFWSQLRCLQRCTTETLLEKNVCWWVRDPLHSTAPCFLSGMLGLGFGIANFQVGLICCQFPGASMIGLICLQFPGGQCDWVEYYPCCSWNLKSQCPKDRERVTHPYVVQHPEK